MQAQDEAIELLESQKRYMQRLQINPQLTEDAMKREARIDQALAKLKEVPEPTYFTKNVRASLERGDSRQTTIAWLKEVCRRYDWLVKRSAELQAENKQLVDGQVAKKEAGS